MNSAILVQALTVAGLVAIMLSMGLKVAFEDVVSSSRRLPSILSSLVANFVLVPAATIGLLSLFDADPMVSVGFLILAVCPGAPVGPPFAAIAKGNVHFAIAQMVILAGLSVVLSPALLKLLLTQLLPGRELRIDYLAIVQTLLIAQLLPLGIGLGISRWGTKLTSRIAKPVGRLANLLLLSVVVLILAREYDTLQLIRFRGWGGMLLLLTVSLAIGWLCGGPTRAMRKSLSITTGARNAAVALVIVSTNFSDTPAVTAVIAYAIVSIFGTLGCAYLFAAMREPGG